MKVAIVHELLVKLGGAERVAKVFADMFPHAPIFTLLYDQKKCGELFPPSRVHFAPGIQRLFSWGIPRRFLISWMNTAVENFNLSKYDLVLSSSSAFAHGVITGTETKHLCYCHSPARYLWDQTFAVQKQQSSRGILAPIKKMVLPGMFHELRKWDALSADRPDKILANSKTVQKRIQKYWNQTSQVVFPPVRTNAFQVHKNCEGYFLIVSALSPFKNIDLAIRVFNKLPKHRLVIIGDGSEKKYLESIAEQNIDFLGRKSDNVVAEYLKNCRALLFPGEDDFGIVPVEAMACGKPVIALKKGGATETIREKETGILFDSPVEESLHESLIRFFQLEKQFDANSIRKHTERFSEHRFRKEIRNCINALMSDKK
jgi:glycosyltransferase involved in cell wall biosynthesis